MECISCWKPIHWNYIFVNWKVKINCLQSLFSFCSSYLIIFVINICHVCVWIFNQFYIHSCYSGLYISKLRLSSICYLSISLCFSLLSLCYHPPFTCSIMCALFVSVHFKATLFMSEVVVPIVRDTLIWWGEYGCSGTDCCPLSTYPCLDWFSWVPYMGYTNTLEELVSVWPVLLSRVSTYFECEKNITMSPSLKFILIVTLNHISNSTFLLPTLYYLKKHSGPLSSYFLGHEWA